MAKQDEKDQTGSESPDEGQNDAFQNFEDLAKIVLRTPKSEIDRTDKKLHPSKRDGPDQTI